MRCSRALPAATAAIVLALATGCGSSSKTTTTTTAPATPEALAAQVQSRLAAAGYEVSELTVARPASAAAGTTPPAAPVRSLSVAPKGTAASQTSLNARLRALDTKIATAHGVESKADAAAVDRLRSQIARVFVVNVNVFRNAADVASHVGALESANTAEIEKLRSGWPQPGPVLRYRVVGKVVFESPVQAAGSGHAVTYAPFDRAAFAKIVSTANNG
jgi:hypothetical protein